MFCDVINYFRGKHSVCTAIYLVNTKSDGVALIPLHTYGLEKKLKNKTTLVNCDFRYFRLIYFCDFIL